MSNAAYPNIELEYIGIEEPFRVRCASCKAVLGAALLPDAVGVTYKRATAFHICEGLIHREPGVDRALTLQP